MEASIRGFFRDSEDKMYFWKLCDKIKSIGKERKSWKEFLRDEVHKGHITNVKRTFRLMKHLKPKKADEDYLWI